MTWVSTDGCAVTTPKTTSAQLTEPAETAEEASDIYTNEFVDPSIGF